MELGDKVRDPVSGFAGTVTSRTEYLGRPDRAIGVVAHKGPSDKEVLEWFPEGRLELVTDEYMPGFA